MDDVEQLIVDLKREVKRSVTPARPSQIEAAEASLGFRLPHDLVRLYLEFANGGFGPGEGLLGVGDGHRRHFDGTLVDVYREYRHPRVDPTEDLSPDDPEWVMAKEGWPDGLLPLCDLAGGFTFFLDATTGEVWFSGPDFVRPGIRLREWLQPEDRSITQWLSRWLAGDYNPRVWAKVKGNLEAG